jgi:DNA-binding GntR family transcriptional regulator
MEIASDVARFNQAISGAVSSRQAPRHSKHSGPRIFEPVRNNRAPIRSQIVATLREAIASGVLQPGQILGEKELCQELGASRTSIREALRCLVSEKLMVTLPGGRMSVSDVCRRDVEATYGLLGVLTVEAVKDFLKIDNVAKTTSDLKLLQSIFVQFRNAVRSAEAQKSIKLSSCFHDSLLTCCGNTMISEIIKNLFTRIGFLRMKILSDMQHARTNVASLHKLLSALRARNFEDTQLAVTHYFQAELQAALSMMSQ